MVPPTLIHKMALYNPSRVELYRICSSHMFEEKIQTDRCIQYQGRFDHFPEGTECPQLFCKFIVFIELQCAIRIKMFTTFTF